MALSELQYNSLILKRQQCRSPTSSLYHFSLEHHFYAELALVASASFLYAAVEHFNVHYCGVGARRPILHLFDRGLLQSSALSYWRFVLILLFLLKMLFASVNVLCTFILASWSFARGSFTESTALSPDATTLTLPCSTSGNEVLEMLESMALSVRDRHHVPNLPEGQPPSQQTLPEQPPSEPHNPPNQVCPTEPPVQCFMPNCLGSPEPPDAYRCKSTSTTTVDSVETTLFACPCCPDSVYCDAEICDGEEDNRCKSELLKGCRCRTRNPANPPRVFIGSVTVCPLPPGFRPMQNRSTTPTEPPPSSSQFWASSNKTSNTYLDITQRGNAQGSTRYYTQFHQFAMIIIS